MYEKKNISIYPWFISFAISELVFGFESPNNGAVVNQ